MRSVRHRIDGLEKKVANIQMDNLVRHRIDGLEKTPHRWAQVVFVRHRIDGLEITKRANPLVWAVRHRIDGLEINSINSNNSRHVRHRIDGLETLVITALVPTNLKNELSEFQKYAGLDTQIIVPVVSRKSSKGGSYLMASSAPIDPALLLTA